MVKLVSIFKLRPGVDPDEAYKVWAGEHSQWVKEKLLPEMKWYTVNRILRKYPGAGGKGSSDFDIFGYAMCWFDDKESALKATERMHKAASDAFLTKYVAPPKEVIAELAKVPF